MIFLKKIVAQDRESFIRGFIEASAGDLGSKNVQVHVDAPESVCSEIKISDSGVTSRILSRQPIRESIVLLKRELNKRLQKGESVREDRFFYLVETFRDFPSRTPVLVRKTDIAEYFILCPGLLWAEGRLQGVEDDTLVVLNHKPGQIESNFLTTGPIANFFLELAQLLAKVILGSATGKMIDYVFSNPKSGVDLASALKTLFDKEGPLIDKARRVLVEDQGWLVVDYFPFKEALVNFKNGRDGVNGYDEYKARIENNYGLLIEKRKRAQDKALTFWVGLGKHGKCGYKYRSLFMLRVNLFLHSILLASEAAQLLLLSVELGGEYDEVGIRSELGSFESIRDLAMIQLADDSSGILEARRNKVYFRSIKKEGGWCTKDTYEFQWGDKFYSRNDSDPLVQPDPYHYTRVIKEANFNEQEQLFEKDLRSRKEKASEEFMNAYPYLSLLVDVNEAASGLREKDHALKPG